MFLERLQPRPLAPIQRSDVPGPQCAGSAASRPAGFRGGSAPADTAVRPGSSGPQAGPGEQQGPGQLPTESWSPGCPPGPVLPPRAGLGTRSQSPGMPRAPGPGDRRRAAVVEGGRARRAIADDQERAPALRCAAPRRAGPARPFRLLCRGPALQAPSWATPRRPLLSLGSCSQSQ